MDSSVYIFRTKYPCVKTPKGWVELKIGKANNVDQRRKQAQTWRPYRLILFKSYRYDSEKQAFAYETMIHRRYAKYATKEGGKEWFIVPILALAEIDNILSGGNPLSWILRTRLRLMSFFNKRFREYYFLRSRIN